MFGQERKGKFKSLAFENLSSMFPGAAILLGYGELTSVATHFGENTKKGEGGRAYNAKRLLLPSLVIYERKPRKLTFKRGF